MLFMVCLTMELVKQFNSELSALYESKPPISKAKMTSITRSAIKAIKLYKHVVQSVEKFIQKCKPEYKVPGLYVIDSIVRQSRHQFGTEKDVFAPRFARNLQQTFIHLFSCPPEDKSKVIRVLNLWQKNAVFESDVIQPLFDLADPNHPVHKDQAALAPTNGITAVKPVSAVNVTPKSASLKKESGTAGWINQLHIDSSAVSVQPNQAKPHAPNQVADVNILQQLQHLQTLLMDQTDKNLVQNKDSDQVKFDKKLLDFDYGEEEDDDGTPAQHHLHHHHHHQQQQQQVVAGLDSIGSILSNPEVLRQLQTLQQTLTNPQNMRQQQLEMEEKLRKMQEMRQQEEEFDKHLAQTIPNLPFADECELKPGGELSGFSGMDLSQPPPGYALQQKLMVPPGMMMKPPPSPLEDGEHASSDADERMGRSGEDGGQSVVVLDSDSPSDSPAHNRRRRRHSRSRSRSHRRSRSESRSRSRSKRKRSSSYEEKDWEKSKRREAEKDRERERKRKGLPSLKKSHLAVCSTTLWIGHLSKLVQQEELSDTFGEFGDIVSIDLIPPRGCAFICMNRRQDAYRALQDLKHHKLQGKAITLAWAPGKGMKGKEYKDFWEVEQGVSYIPWSKLTQDIDLELLEEGGMIDEDSFPDWLKERQVKNKDEDQLRSQSSSQAEDDEASQSVELDIPVPAPTIPGFIPLPDGPQPTDIKVNQPPPNMPMSIPPLGMMPPFGLPNISRLLGPMGMAMGPGLLSNVPLGVPPPGMQGLMGNALMHQQMISRMPQPVGSPFNPSCVGILGGHPQLSQIPLPSNQDKVKTGLAPLGVPPPSDTSGLPNFGDALMQIPFTLPPQLQIPGMGMLSRTSISEKRTEGSTDSETRDFSSPSRPEDIMVVKTQFGHPPPQFSPMSLMKIPPPMMIPPPHSSDRVTMSEDKDERELKDKDYRDILKDYKEKDRERDRDFRNKRDRDFRGDRDYRDRFDKDYRDRDRDYRDREREKKDRREKSREKDDKMDLEIKDKDIDKEKKEDSSKDDRNYKDRNDRDKGRNRDRGRDRISKWCDRDRERGRERDREDKRSRDKEKDRGRELKGSGDRDKGTSDRQRSTVHDQERNSRGGMESGSFQGQGSSKFGERNENFHQEEFQSDMQGHHHPGNRRDGFTNRGSRDMFDHRGPLPDEFDPRGPPPEGFGNRGPPHDNFNTRGSADSFCRPPESFGPRGPPFENFGVRGPPPDAFGPRGPPPDGFNLRGPPPGSFGPSDGFGPRGPPLDFDGQGPPPESFIPRGPPPDSFNRGLLPDNFGPGGPPPVRGPLGDDFNPQGHPSFEGFSGPQGPAGEFQPRIRIEFFPRGRGRGLQDNFRGRGGRGAMMFSPRGGGSRGPRPGNWMEGQGPPAQPGFGFPPRSFPSPDMVPERFGSPMFDDGSHGRGSQIRGRGRGFQGRSEEHKREDDEFAISNPKRTSRWSNPSPPPAFALQNTEENSMQKIETAETLVIKEKTKDGSKDTFLEPTNISQEETSNTLPPDVSTTNNTLEVCGSQQINSPNAADVSLKGGVVFNDSVEVQQSTKNLQEESILFSPKPVLPDLELTNQSKSNPCISLNQSFEFDFDMSNITERRTSIEKSGSHLNTFAESRTEFSTLDEMEIDQLHTQEESISELQQSLDSFNQNFNPSVVAEPQEISTNITNVEHAEDYEEDKTIPSYLIGQKSSEIIVSEDHLCNQSPVVSSQANNQLLFDESSPSLFNDLETNFNSFQQENTLCEGEMKEQNLGPSLSNSSENVSNNITNPAEAFNMTSVETQEKGMAAPQSGVEVKNDCEVNEPTVPTEQNCNFEVVEEKVESVNPSTTN